MRIIRVCVLLSCLVVSTLSAEAQRPKDERGKRNLEYQVSHPYAGPPSNHLERRISLGPHHSLYPPPQFYPGPPRPYSPFRKGRPHSYPVPPYAVQMEPLVHYSQRDPLYDTNTFPLNADPHNDLAGDDLLTENNHIHENVQHGHHYGYRSHKPQIIERPVYIKEPEPIIEIIIKESNVSLPAPPPTPPPKKKKEQVQVFYVKYKKNPHGVGKDSVIYDKPIPAISPNIPDDEEEEDEASYNYQQETATASPPPTTTLRTIIKPDSEVYHSPSGIKVTFGKEGFDYSKRSSKPQDYNPAQPAPGFPQGRQLASFSNTYFKRPYTNQNIQSPPPSPPAPSQRVPQPYRPFIFPSQPQPNYKQGGRQSPPQFASHQKIPFQPPQFAKSTSQQYSSFPSTRHQPQLAPHFSHSVSHPAPPSFQSSRPLPPPPPPPPHTRQPVPYKPFDYLRPQETFSKPPQPSNIPPNNLTPTHYNPNPSQPQIQFRPETHFPIHQQLPLPDQSHIFDPSLNQQEQLPQVRSQQIRVPQQTLQNQRFEQNHFQQVGHNQQQQQIQHQQQQIQQQNINNQNEHLTNLQSPQSILPPGGQLIQSVPKYEQHISEIQPINRQENLQGLSPQELQQKLIPQLNFNNALAESQKQNPQADRLQQQVQQQLQHQQQHQQIIQERNEQQRRQQEEQLRTAQQYYQNNQQEVQRSIPEVTPRTSQQSTRREQVYVSSTPKVSYQSSTAKPTTTTEEPDKPSTTTKDPKILEAQLPDEVPDDLREQLLSSGILNNADISVLDYDKVGDIPLSALPPDQLANFYSAGGAAQISSGSAPVPSILQTDGSDVEKQLDDTEVEEDQDPEASEIQEVRAVSQPTVEMKVVKYDPETDKGQKVQESYVDKNAQQVDPVVLNDESYNRYLPLKVNGSQFPIPDVPELKGKKISSVVVLAPVTYDFSSKRTTRKAPEKPSDIDLIQGDALKQLLDNPNEDNYKKFLESEKKTSSDKQSVILLVTDPEENESKEKEIYMYDVATQTVSKLSGELSSAFVEAAEANSDEKAEVAAAESNIVESRVSYDGNIDRVDTVVPDTDDSASDIVETKVIFSDSMHDEDMETGASEQLLRIDIARIPVDSQNDSAASNNQYVKNGVLISSGYSKTDHS